MRVIFFIFLTFYVSSSLGLKGGELGVLERPVYKIMTEVEFSLLVENGFFVGGEADVKSGFIHLAAEEQLKRVVGKYYSNVPKLVIVKFSDPLFLEKLRWEPASNGDLYPHLYGCSLLYSEVESYKVLTQLD